MNNSDSLSSYLPKDLLTELFDTQSQTLTTPNNISTPLNRKSKVQKWKKSSSGLESKTTNEVIQLQSKFKPFTRSQTQPISTKGLRRIDTMNIELLKKYYVKEPIEFTPALFSNNIPIKEFLYNLSTKLPVIVTSSNGSQFLLRKINDFTEEDIAMFILFLCKDLIGVMCDIYGHVFIQQMILTKTNSSQRLEILKLIKPFFIQISNDQYGSICIVSLIQSIQSKGEELIVKNATKKYILELSLNAYSCQIILQLMVNLADKKRSYLIKYISFNFFSFCNNINSIKVLVKFITELKDSIAVDTITSSIESNLLQFTLRKELNVIVYQILNCFCYSNCIKVINSILNNILLLSNNEYGVKIVDKVINVIQCSNACKYNNLISFIFLNTNNTTEIINTQYGRDLLKNIWRSIPLSMRKIIQEKQTYIDYIISSVDRLDDQLIMNQLHDEGLLMSIGVNR